MCGGGCIFSNSHLPISFQQFFKDSTLKVKKTNNIPTMYSKCGKALEADDLLSQCCISDLH